MQFSQMRESIQYLSLIVKRFVLRHQSVLKDIPKFFVKSNGDTTVEKQGKLNEREIKKIREFIKSHYKEMYFKWREIADIGFYGENKC